jgi:anti-sigma regulatory factor (Ser/Thr protein kinase)
MTRQEAPVFERTFQPVFESAREARHFAREAARALGGEDVVDSVEMLVGELAVNAVLHAQTPFSVSLSVPRARVVRVEVCDENPDRPRLKAATGDDLLIHGRGLAVIDALAQRWGVVGRDGGKCVWAEVGP